MIQSCKLWLKVVCFALIVLLPLYIELLDELLLRLDIRSDCISILNTNAESDYTTFRGIETWENVEALSHPPPFFIKKRVSLLPGM